MSDDTERIKQDDIEALLKQSQSQPQEKSEAPEPPPADVPLDQNEIEALMKGSAAAQPATPTGGDADKVLGQSDIESLLSGAGPAEMSAPKPPTMRAGAEEKGEIPQRDIELLIDQAEQAIESVKTGLDAPTPEPISRFQFEDFAGAEPSAEVATLDLLRDVELDLRIELGRTNLYLEEVLKMRKGSVVPLDRLAGDPVDVYVNGRLIARGEVLVLNDNFCVRVAELVVGEALVQ